MTKTDNTEALKRGYELLDRIDEQCRHVGHPVGGISELKHIIRAALTLQVPEGWQLVPKEPTKEMTEAVCPKGGFHDEADYFLMLEVCRLDYKAMLAAAPVYGTSSTTFKRGDLVRKKGNKGQWHGKIVGEYSASCTEEGYAIESLLEKGSVQIYPASALEPWDGKDGG